MKKKSLIILSVSNLILTVFLSVFLMNISFGHESKNPVFYQMTFCLSVLFLSIFFDRWTMIAVSVILFFYFSNVYSNLILNLILFFGTSLISFIFKTVIENYMENDPNSRNAKSIFGFVFLFFLMIFLNNFYLENYSFFNVFDFSDFVFLFFVMIFFILNFGFDFSDPRSRSRI